MARSHPAMKAAMGPACFWTNLDQGEQGKPSIPGASPGDLYIRYRTHWMGPEQGLGVTVISELQTDHDGEAAVDSSKAT